MFGGLAVPPYRFGKILRHAAAVLVHGPEVVLGKGVSLFGGLAVPPHRLNVVLRDAAAVGVHEPEIVLSHGMAPLGQRLELANRGGIVAAIVRFQTSFETGPRGQGESGEQSDGDGETFHDVKSWPPSPVGTTKAFSPSAQTELCGKVCSGPASVMGNPNTGSMQVLL